MHRCLMMSFMDRIDNLLDRFPSASAFPADDIAADIILLEVCVENKAFFFAADTAPNNGGVDIRRG